MKEPKSKGSKRERYGIRWDRSLSDLEIEFQMIGHGGKFTIKGQEVGDGTFEHMMRARALLWPDRYRHRWTDLMYREFISNSVTILIGSGSSQKTAHACEFALINYFVWPDDTLVILSTTTVEKLQMVLFGEIKKLWRAAVDRYEWLPGHPVESKNAIATDDIKEAGVVRDFRKGIKGIACFQGRQFVGLGSFAGIKQKRIIFVADELQFMACFPSGTLIDTPKGQIPIEQIEVGDEVLTAIGPRRVRGTVNRSVRSLVTVISKDGRRIVCTPEHRFFTQKGWIKACDLSEEYYMLSAHEAMLTLRQGNSGLQNMQGMSEKSSKDMRMVQKGIQVEKSTFQIAFLRSILQREMDNEPTSVSGESLYQGEIDQGFNIQDGMVEIATGTERKTGIKIEGIASDAQSRILQESRGGNSEGWMPPADSWWKRDGSHQGGVAIDEDVSRGDLEPCHKDRHESWQRLSAMLQGGYCISRGKVGSRGRRFYPQQPNAARSGQEEGSFPCGSWVDRVEVQQQGDPEFRKAAGGSQSCTVYNLEVEGHPSYSVNGFLVHNCTFLDCLPNMMQGSEHLKVIGSGNPKHDPYDQLGKAAEPEAGWQSLPKIEKTTVWKTKFHNGRCVNLVGTDSPNFDYPETARTKYPGLIGWSTVKAVEAFWGRQSLQFSSQCLGVMQIGMIGNRVITEQICREHRALEKAIWKNQDRIRVYGLDPAWGGPNADRCVAGWGEFGISDQEIQIFRVNRPVIVPINPASLVPPDDQIAQFIQNDAELAGIEPENIFYDSTGKGTTGSAFARVFGSRVPVPISFGDKPSSRPVRHDLFITLPNGVKRLKRCDEHYSKFVSELWFSVRYVIECEQLRELPEDVMIEGTLREYGERAGASGTRIEVEPKHKTIERMGKSPDLFDWISILIEAARQRGFQIRRMGITHTESESSDDYLTEESERYRSAIEANLLTHH